ncbi:MAG: type II toxin-antitoxin system HicA family toxin, partial [bacterium]|nr:type II toxin-antitoxin system HicA family toxin [bacterium]
TYRELRRKLRALGREFESQARGSHEIWRNPATAGRTTIPNWGSKDLRVGTIAVILRDLHLDRADFDRA